MGWLATKYLVAPEKTAKPYDSWAWRVFGIAISTNFGYSGSNSWSKCSRKIMLTDTDQYQQASFFGVDLLDQLDASDPLLALQSDSLGRVRARFRPPLLG